MPINILGQKPDFGLLTSQTDALKQDWQKRLGETDDEFQKRIEIKKQADMLKAIPSMFKSSNNIQPEVQQVQNEQPEEKGLINTALDDTSGKLGGTSTGDEFNLISELIGKQNSEGVRQGGLYNKKFPDRLSGFTNKIAGIKQLTRPAPVERETGFSTGEKIGNIGGLLGGMVGLFDRSDQGKEWGRNQIGSTSDRIMNQLGTDKDRRYENAVYNQGLETDYERASQADELNRLGMDMKIQEALSGQDQQQMNNQASVLKMLQDMQEQEANNNLKTLLAGAKGNDKLLNLLNSLIAKEVMGYEEPGVIGSLYKPSVTEKAAQGEAKKQLLMNILE